MKMWPWRTQDLEVSILLDLMRSYPQDMGRRLRPEVEEYSGQTLV